MRVRHFNGVEVDASEGKARRLVSGGSWTYVDAPPPEPEPEPTAEPQAEQVSADVPEKPVATIAEMRAWAIENGVEDVPAKGRLPRHAIAAYRAAHEEV